MYAFDILAQNNFGFPNFKTNLKFSVYLDSQPFWIRQRSIFLWIWESYKKKILFEPTISVLSGQFHIY